MTSEELLDTAMAEYERGDYADAEEDFGEFIRRNPEEASAHFNRALARYQLAKLADAEADLDVYLSMDPRSAAAFELRAFVRLGRGNVAGALADANVGLRIQEAPGLRAARGRALTGKGEYEEAVKDLDIALAANEADDEARFARGDCHLNLGRLKEACADLSIVAERHGELVPVAEKLGDARFRLLDFDGALAAMERVAGVESFRGRGARKMGYAYYAAGRYEDAVNSLQLALASERLVSPWGAAVLHVAWVRAKRPGESPLAGLLEKIEEPWGKAVCQMLLKQLSEDEVLAKANATEDAKMRNGRLCEAYFYLGTARLIAGDKIAGRAMLAQAVATECKTFIEYTLARAELARP